MVEANPVYASVDGVVFSKDLSILHYFPTGRGGSYTVPSFVERIDDGAFSGCTAVSEVTVSEGVTSIGGWGFNACSMSAIHLPDSLTSIEQDAFQTCYRLT